MSDQRPVISGSPVQSQIDARPRVQQTATVSPGATPPPPPTSTQPPPPPTAAPPEPAQIEDLQQGLSTPLKIILAAALLKAIGGERSGPGLPFDVELVNVSKLTRKAVIAWLSEMARIFKVDVSTSSPSMSQAALETRISQTASRWASEHERETRKTFASLPASEEADAHDRWAEAAAKTLATQLQSEASMALAKMLEPRDADGNILTVYKVWMTRSDSKVRNAHRDLHGQIRGLDEPFMTWPITHQMLKYPGDPSAPLRQTIGCRCFMWFGWGPDAEDFAETLRADNESFDKQPNPIMSGGSDFTVLACSTSYRDMMLLLERAAIEEQ